MTVNRHKLLKWSILVALLAYAAVMSVWAHREAHLHVCTGIEIQVDGSQTMDSVIRHGVTEELYKYPRKIVGVPLHEINTPDIEKYLSKYNNFESVNCMITSRGKLIVRIVPLIPVMRVFFGDNSYYINKDGKHVVSNAEFFNEVPIVSGSFNRNFTPKGVLPLVNYIKKDAMLNELVSMIEAKDAENLILIPRIRGHVINFGDTLHLDEKKRALTLFYRQVLPYKGWEEYDTISVKFRGQVVATRRDKTRLNHAEQYIEDIDLEEGTLPEAPPASANTTAKPDSTAQKASTTTPSSPTKPTSPPSTAPSEANTTEGETTTT